MNYGKRLAPSVNGHAFAPRIYFFCQHKYENNSVTQPKPPGSTHLNSQIAGARQQIADSSREVQDHQTTYPLRADIVVCLTIRMRMDRSHCALFGSKQKAEKMKKTPDTAAE